MHRKAMSKYNARKTTIDGNVFDSKSEARRWQELQLLQIAGEIRDLERQTSFDITINGVKVCRYKADFTYWENGTYIVEDVKSEATRKLPAYRLKNKLMKAVHNIDITEVMA